jgi:hypothetical protein
MAIETINVGQIPNDGTGDDLREAFIKVNNNILELDNRTANPITTAENLAGPGVGIFAGQQDNVLEFKKLQAGSNVNLTTTNNTITIQADGGIDEIFVLADEGSLKLDDSVPFHIQGKDIIKTVSPTDNSLSIEIANSGILAYDTVPKLSVTLDANDQNIQNANTIVARTIKGPLSEPATVNLEGNVHDIDIRDINRYFDNYWDFGEISPDGFNGILDYIIFNTDVDMGTFNEPASFDVDLGDFI